MNGSFDGLTGLTAIYFNAVRMDDCEYALFMDAGANSSGATFTVGAGVQRIPAGLMEGGYDYENNIISIVFVDGSVCTEVAVGAFGCCRNLREIVLRPALMSIGDYAFSHCFSLETVIYYRNGITPFLVRVSIGSDNEPLYEARITEKTQIA